MPSGHRVQGHMVHLDMTSDPNKEDSQSMVPLTGSLADVNVAMLDPIPKVCHVNVCCLFVIPVFGLLNDFHQNRDFFKMNAKQGFFQDECKTGILTCKRIFYL